MTYAVLRSVQVGLPRQFGAEGAADPMDRPWTTGFYKEAVDRPVRLGTTNLEGDGQADLVHHGGPDKAVLAYSGDHYAYWRQALSNPSLPYGAFGENLTMAGQTEAEVCIGDTWQIGDGGDGVILQVSQPRQPCWKLARRWRVKTLALQVQEAGYTGWYLRVLREGVVAAGMPVTLLERPCPQWTVGRANRVMHVDKHDLAAAAELASLPLLARSWQSTLLQRAERSHESDPAKRLFGSDEMR